MNHHCTHHRNRPALATIVAFLSLLVASIAIGTSSDAAGMLTGKQIKNSSITGKDLKNGTVTGRDVLEASLEIPYAAAAGDARTVGGQKATDLLQAKGCQSGKVLGYVRIKANGGSVPDDYTSSNTFVDTVGNCSSSLVVVRKLALGRYLVKFPSNPAWLAFAQVRFDNENADADVCAAVRRVVAAGTDKGAFEVSLRQCGTPIYRDADFTLLLP